MGVTEAPVNAFLATLRSSKARKRRYPLSTLTLDLSAETVYSN
jgi:hypothetical protein